LLIRVLQTESEPYSEGDIMKTKTKDNPVLASLVDSLSREKKPIWKRVRAELSKPRRQRVEVNLSKIEAYGDDGATIIVPGKVLGSGGMTKKLTVAAFSFSGTARKLIGDAGGKAISIEALVKSNPDGRGVVLLK
jgi:large subunit ribosomal protein L18e